MATPIEPVASPPRLITRGDGLFARRRLNGDQGGISMRSIATSLVTTSPVGLAGLAAARAQAADLDASSAVDAVTVYPDGASVTRVITLDLPAGDHSAVLKDFPLALDPSSLRVEGEAGTEPTLGAAPARPPPAPPPVNLPEPAKTTQALKDE